MKVYKQSTKNKKQIHVDGINKVNLFQMSSHKHVTSPFKPTNSLEQEQEMSKTKEDYSSHILK